MSADEALERLEEFQFREKFLASYLFYLNVPTRTEDIEVIEALKIAIAALEEKVGG